MARTAKTSTSSKSKTSKGPDTPTSTTSAKAAPPADETRRADPEGARIVAPTAPHQEPAAPPEADAATSETTSGPEDGAAEVTRMDDAPAASPPVVVPQDEETSGRGGGFLPLFLGGVVAAGLGFVVAMLAFPQEPPTSVDADRIDALAAEIDTLKAADAPAPDLSEIEAALAALEVRVDALESRAPAGDATAEAAPAGLTSEEVAAELAPLRDEIAALSGDLGPRVAALEAEVADLADRATAVRDDAAALARESARNQVRVALQSGAPYAEPLAVLGDAPEALAGPAATGVPTQAALIDTFPELAREALRAARAAEPAAGVGSLFRNAFNPRSLEPREGDDPDAVLSRIEAAVRGGDLDAAQAEIAALPAEAQAVLAPWQERVAGRAAALSAADDFLQDE
ncbi:COG4223 family protein [Jannaschia marina]|uniref:COG4223 family protein n=1 Tax=Jannaschia marina TaxID=2741674 RepID=UPI0015C81753|nr:hypothetical protein [Jannaschia marina]